ncbi:MAG: antibiotic biosynthesis monooxygenase [Chloroflexota bacterium]|nr:antibiotic biosynthesis monooxygenase [Chloroflexota bacterium]
MRGDPQRIDEGIAMVREEIAPAVQELDGCIGASLLVDRSTGSSIMTSAWENEDAMRASAQRVQPLRERGADLLSATPEVREWEIAVLHRERAAPEGACASVTWTRGEPQHVDRNLQIFRDQLMPRLVDLDGFCSVSLFINRAEGRGVTATVFCDRAALDSARQALDEIRRGAVEQLSLELLDVAEFDVAYAHLRVPEMA